MHVKDCRLNGRCFEKLQGSQALYFAWVVFCMRINLAIDGSFEMVCKAIVCLWLKTIASGFVGVTCKSKLALVCGARIGGFSVSAQ